MQSRLLPRCYKNGSLLPIPRLHHMGLKNTHLLGRNKTSSFIFRHGSATVDCWTKGLKLGKRTYFEDATGSGSAKPLNGQYRSAVTTKKLKGSSQANQVPGCQVEGCKADLSSAKEYHRCHKICEMHLKTLKNMVAGQEQRFYQQCSRFHGLSELRKASVAVSRCLARHNERCRKHHLMS